MKNNKLMSEAELHLMIEEIKRLCKPSQIGVGIDTDHKRLPALFVEGIFNMKDKAL